MERARFEGRASGVDPARLRQGLLAPLKLEAAELELRDRTLLTRLAALLRGEDRDLRRELERGMVDVIGKLSGNAARNQAAAAGFLEQPGRLHASLRLKGPTAVQDLATDHVLGHVLARFQLELESGNRLPAGEPSRDDRRATERFFARLGEGAAESPTTTVLTGDGRGFGHLGPDPRYPVELGKLPAHVVRAFLAAEDAAFYQHQGVDPTALVRAVLRNLRAGERAQGGSTITQQLIKRTVVGPERSLGRKLKEALLAIRLEQVMTKDEILRLYLDQVYFGTGAYGIEAAARTYFAKPATGLTVPEAAVLAGLPKAPSASNPYRDPEAAWTRARWVLGRMRDQGWLTAFEHDRAVAAKLRYRPVPEAVWTAGGWYLEEVRRWLQASYPDRTGLEVTAAIDLEHQAAAEAAVSAGLGDAEARIGATEGALQAALVSIDPRSGRILALVGGRDFGESQFNRATQARRQAGSAFKPFVVSAALDHGFTAASVLEDAPKTFLDPVTHEPWEPANFGDKYYGKVLLRTAIVRSLNLATVRLAEAVGVAAVRDRAKALGIEDVPPYLSIALGSTDVSLLAMTRAYTAFARGGSWIEPALVLSVKDAEGRSLYTAKPRVTEALRPENAYVVTTLLQEVIRSGTATVCRELGRGAAGKTGTSNEARDGWFIGYTPYLVTGVWVGFDDGTPMGDEGVGGRVAAPIWLSYRQAVEDGYPPEDFPRPPGVEVHRVSARELGAEGDGDAFYDLAFEGGAAPALY